MTGTVALPGGLDMVMPGDTASLVVELGKPVAVREKSRFAIREGHRTVGAGVITRVLE